MFTELLNKIQEMEFGYPDFKHNSTFREECNIVKNILSNPEQELKTLFLSSDNESKIVYRHVDFFNWVVLKNMLRKTQEKLSFVKNKEDEFFTFEELKHVIPEEFQMSFSSLTPFHWNENCFSFEYSYSEESKGVIFKYWFVYVEDFKKFVVIKDTFYLVLETYEKSSLVQSMISNQKLGSTEITFNPICGYSEEQNKFTIQFNHMHYSDWMFLKILIKELGFEKTEPDDYHYNVSTLQTEDGRIELLSKEQLDLITIPVCDCSEYISSRETIRGNAYDSNCDTYGSQLNTMAIKRFFLYIVEIDQYAVIEGDYWCM